jgi:hypothetical protein
MNRRRCAVFLSLTMMFLVALGVTNSGFPVHGSIDDELFGEKISVGNPVPAVVIEEDQLGVGNSSTFIYRLVAGHRYHIYLSGDWADPEEHTTDYDIYVYEIDGVRALFYSSHTESAGIPEQVANDAKEQYFVPEETGLYYFVVRNDAIESSAAEQATLMILEHVETDEWVSRNMKGKVNEQPVALTTWSYEFVTSAPRIRVFVDVPDTLDMYEVRLFLMANPAGDFGEIINGIPVAWEPGLRAEVSGVYGGFNLDPQGFRWEDAMASCERNGEDMVIEFDAPLDGELLYHLVLIAEYGAGRIQVLIQTDFDPPSLTLIDAPETVEAWEPVEVGVNAVDEIPLKSITCRYHKGDRWRAIILELETEHNYKGIIPSVPPGTVVEYVFEAEDAMGNTNQIGGEYKAIGSSSLTFSVDDVEYLGGEDVKVNGRLQPPGGNVTITYWHEGDTYNFSVATDPLGIFTHALRANSTGHWRVHAEYSGDGSYLPSLSEALPFVVLTCNTRLSFSLSSQRLEFGKSVTVSGEFSFPKGGLLIELTAKRPDKVEEFWATTTESGEYEATFEPPFKGEWTFIARVAGDGLVYSGATSSQVKLEVVNPRLTTTVLRFPTTIMNGVGGLLEPPLLYGVVGFVGIAGGGIVIYMRRRE